MILQVVLFHLLTRVITLGAISLFAVRGRDLSASLTAWDGKWYGIIATIGYPNQLPENENGVVTNPAGFFPLLPLLLRPFLAVGVPYWLAVAMEALVFSTAAAIMVMLVVRQYSNDRIAVLTSFCWSVFPTASVLSAAYAEGLFTLLAAATLYFVFRKQWVLAGMMAALAGATRPTGVAVVAGVAVSVVVAIWKGREWRSLIALAIAPLGTLGAIGFIGWSTGRLDAWLVTQSQGWQVRFDCGLSTMRWAWNAVTVNQSPVRLSFLAAVIVAVAAAVIAAIRRPPPAVFTYLVLGTILAIGQGGKFYLSPLRFLLPVFPLLVPIADWLSRRRTGTAMAILLAFAIVSARIGAYYFSGTPSGASP